MVAVQSRRGNRSGFFYIQIAIVEQTFFRKMQLYNLTDNHDCTIDIEVGFLNKFESGPHPRFFHKGSIEAIDIQRCKMTGIELRYVFGKLLGGSMGFSVNTLMNMVERKKTCIHHVFECMPPNARAIGSEK